MAIDWTKVKDKLADFADQVKEGALDFTDDFKRQSKWFKARVGVIAGYVLLILLTFIIAPKGSESNPIDAKIIATSIPWGVSNKTILEVVNESGDDYEALVVVVDGVDTVEGSETQRPGTWSYSRTKLREGEALQLEAKHFSNDDGEGPSMGFVPNVVELRCSEGSLRKKIKMRVMR